jgi:hypothetical protein
LEVCGRQRRDILKLDIWNIEILAIDIEKLEFEIRLAVLVRIADADAQDVRLVVCIVHLDTIVRSRRPHQFMHRGHIESAPHFTLTIILFERFRTKPEINQSASRSVHAHEFRAMLVEDHIRIVDDFLEDLEQSSDGPGLHGLDPQTTPIWTCGRWYIRHGRGEYDFHDRNGAA